MQVVWFKRDLRVADHAPLAAAAAAAAGTGGQVLPLYTAEPGLWAQEDAAGRHWAFIAESLHELRAGLAQRGQPLVVRMGEVVPVLARLLRSCGRFTLWSHEETGNRFTYDRDLAVAAFCRAAGLAWHELPQTGVVRRLKSRNGWAKGWDQRMGEAVLLPPGALVGPVPAPDPGAIPTADQLGLAPDPCPGRQPGGRAAGLALLDSFLSHRGRPYRRAMSTPLEGAEACSRLSPHLAFGTLSLKEVAQAVWARQKAEPDPVWRGALSSFEGRLHWHCHFMQKLEDAPRIEFECFHRAYAGLRPEPADPQRLEAWAKGRTGWPFVDACMRSLRATGWLNFRMRAMVMAVASYHLWLPWRASGLVLARLFTDYEPGIHWSQVQMQSGTTGINTIRIYNPVKQGVDQDPQGQFIRRWVPELADCPDGLLHEPWRWPGLAGSGYPAPLVDHAEAARAARDAVWAVRRAAGFGEEAAAIQNRHGSRKSGMPGLAPVRARRKARPGAPGEPAPQLDLFG
jgi:deoxyribodipyrimidine photo-lyase